jgi:two-component system NtrC family response regulator
VRELENCVERLTIVAPGQRISLDKLAACSVSGAASGAASGLVFGSAPEYGGMAQEPALDWQQYKFPINLDLHLEKLERALICKALEETQGVQNKAAELLGISERSMWHRIKKLSINILSKKEIQ